LRIFRNGAFHLFIVKRDVEEGIGATLDNSLRPNRQHQRFTVFHRICELGTVLGFRLEEGA
jgi:hypothetical protein